MMRPGPRPLLALLIVAGGGACINSEAGRGTPGGSGGAAMTGSGGAPAGSGGTAGGSGGSGGTPATADAAADDARPTDLLADGPPIVDPSGLPPLTPCTAPAVSRLKVWEMDISGGTAAPGGSPLRKVGDGYEFHVAWTLNGGGYGTANTPLNNKGQYSGGADPSKSAADVSGATGLFLEYSATGSTYMQLRTGAVPHGGDHFRATLPVTGDQLRTLMLNFADFRRPGGKTPPGPEILRDVFSLTFVANGTTTVTLRQIRVAGFVPPCD